MPPHSPVPQCECPAYATGVSCWASACISDDCASDEDEARAIMSRVHRRTDAVNTTLSEDNTCQCPDGGACATNVIYLFVRVKELTATFTQTRTVSIVTLIRTCVGMECAV